MDKKIELKYTIEDIIADSDDLTPFQCQICLGSVIDFKQSGPRLSYDVLQCRNGHISCRECWQRHLTNKQECPSCKVKTIMGELSRNIFLENSFRSLKVVCPNTFKESKFQGEFIRDENGCMENIKVESLENHLKECKYSFIRCPNDSKKCKFIIRINQLSNHNKLNCEFIEIQCEKCKEFLIKSKINKHLEFECNGFIINCNNCDAQIGKKEMKSHLDHDCPKVEIPCLYQQGGCNARFQRDQLSNHLLESNNHIAFIQNIIDLHKLQLQECNEDYKKLENNQKDLEKRIQYLENTVTLNNNIDNGSSNNNNNNNNNNSNNSGSPNIYEGKWIVNNWDKKLKDYPMGKSLNSPFFYIGQSKFFIMLYPNGNNDLKGCCSIFLYKIFDQPTTVKYSIEVKNTDPSKNLKNSHQNQFINNNGNGWFKWLENKIGNGFFSQNSLTVYIKVKVINDRTLTTD